MAAGNDHGLMSDGQPSAGKVDLVPAEAEHLTATQAGGEHEGPQHGVPILGGGVAELASLLCGPHVHGWAGHAGKWAVRDSNP